MNYGVRRLFLTRPIPRPGTPMTHRDNHPPTPDSCSNGQWTTVKANPDQTDRESVIQTVVTTISEAIGKEPIDIPPLYNTIDLDALARLFGWGSMDPPRVSSGSVNFHYEGCEVTVFADGQVVVSSPEG